MFMSLIITIRRFRHDNPIVAHLIKINRLSRQSIVHFRVQTNQTITPILIMEIDDSFPCSEESKTDSYCDVVNQAHIFIPLVL
jgi:hypothetical protein